MLSAISDRNKLFKIFKRTRQLEDEKLYKKAKHSTQKLIKNKKKNYIENKLKEYVSKPKELWKTPKSLGLSDMGTSSGNICIKNDNELSFDTQKNVESFKEFFGNLAKNLVSKLPIAPLKFNKSTLSSYYEKLNLKNNSFKFSIVSEEQVLK